MAGDTIVQRRNKAPFGDYARYYDLLYGDKDYAAEADYVARIIRAELPVARSILELGAGTGRHGRLLAVKGFDVRGIEQSPDMAALAGADPTVPTHGNGGSFRCEVGDARSIRIDGRFDAVIALFHVVSYQTTDADLNALFASAAHHLGSGGIFLFDVWHGPAVLAQLPERRVKTIGNGDHEIVRTAQPELDPKRCTVKITYDVECRNLRSGESARFAEEHLLRYLFPGEIEMLAAQRGLRVTMTEEFMTGRPPSPETWGVAYLLRK